VHTGLIEKLQKRQFLIFSLSLLSPRTSPAENQSDLLFYPRL